MVPCVRNDVVLLPSLYCLLQHRAQCKDGTEWFIIGGSSLYNYFLHNPDLINKIYWTRVLKDYECDVALQKPMTDFLDDKKWTALRPNQMLNDVMDGEAQYYELTKN